MALPDFSDFSFAKFAAGVVGALSSLQFMKGSFVEKVLMVIGGSALSYYAATPTAHWLGSVADEKVEGLVGYMIGLFGMAIIAKVYEVIQMLDSAKMAKEVFKWAKKKWSA